MNTQSVPYFESVFKKLLESPNLRKGAITDQKGRGGEAEFRSMLAEATYTWTVIELQGRLNSVNIPFSLSPVFDWQLASMLESVLTKSITVLNGKEVLMHLFKLGEKKIFREPKELIKELGFEVVNDGNLIRDLCVASVKDNANAKQWKVSECVLHFMYICVCMCVFV